SCVSPSPRKTGPEPHILLFRREKKYQRNYPILVFRREEDYQQKYPDGAAPIAS
ncbi:hypothetical protein HDV00_010783, partial [Rhizophlyctis rosea]